MTNEDNKRKFIKQKLNRIKYSTNIPVSIKNQDQYIHEIYITDANIRSAHKGLNLLCYINKSILILLFVLQLIGMKTC